MNRFMRGRRCFVVLILVSAACLVPGTVGAAAAGAADKLQVLVNDTAAQFQLAYRQHPEERARRQEQLAAAIAAWRSAPRSDANNQRLASWLRSAILSSMPGSHEPLPAVPNFAAIVKAEPQPAVNVVNEAPVAPQTVEKAVETKAPVAAAVKQEDDPFRDDPVSDSEQK